MEVRIEAHFEKGYIGHPYWPAREKLINIQKESGVNRVRSEQRREKALRDYLSSKGLTMADYSALEVEADIPFYTRDGTPEIVIPAHHVHGMMANACDLCSSSIRIARTEQIRTVVTSTDWATGKMAADGVWERFVVVKSGSGQALSNQRALRTNPYIGVGEKGEGAAFNTTGELHFIGDKEQLPKLQEFLAWAGREIGLGAARKLGWGRFEIVKFEAISETA